MLEVPEYIQKAVDAIQLLPSEDGEIDRWSQEFIARWGGCDLATLQMILLQKQKHHDRLIALFAIGYANDAQTLDILDPYLRYGSSEERFASAMSLWDTHYELAFSTLLELLLNELDAFEDPDASANFWLAAQFSDVILFLGKWGDKRAIPTLRQLLFIIWQIMQRALTQSPSDRERRWQNELHWEGFIDYLSMALGRLGAFGALTGLPLSVVRLRVSQIYLALGSLQTDGVTCRADDLTYGDNDEVRGLVLAVLEQCFGLDAELSLFCVDHFYKDLLARYDGSTA